MIIIYFITFFITTISINADEFDSNKFLLDYGYLKGDNASLTDEKAVKDAVKLFQESFHLPVNGELNSKTIALMREPRCGVPDILPYVVSRIIWRKPELKWHYQRATAEKMKLANIAFDEWAKHTSLSFKHDYYGYDILISDKYGIHTCAKNDKVRCSSKFDGPGGVLAHAFSPNTANTPIEIHIDEEENWNFYPEGKEEKDKTNLLSTLMHEIGHALGVRHSFNKDALMYPLLNKRSNLSEDDILAIQSLYGSKAMTTTAKPVQTTKSTTVPKSSEVITDVCAIKEDDENKIHYLLVNGKVYVIFKKQLWIINIANSSKYDSKNYYRPLEITERLKFLSLDTFKGIDAMYQRPNGEIVLIENHKLFMFNLNTQQLVIGYPRNVCSHFNIGHPCTINGIVNTYTGKTYVIYNEDFVGEINECSFTVARTDLVSNLFPGIPADIDGVTRFNNGLLYFFKNGNYYEYNEFFQKVIRFGTKDHELFGLLCYSNNILKQFTEFIKNI
ncbi:matrix metalloproteinase-18-like [Lycorma delicatula]|uniref:matrix metalloproteinase-18-like n=1 Tax=Lycorma delicatula TaxID=130591 RepID=UPI003F516226